MAQAIGGIGELLIRAGLSAPARETATGLVEEKARPNGGERQARGSRPFSHIPNARPALFNRLDRLFVPAYGFDDQASAERHLGKVGLTVDDKPRTIAQTIRRDRTYVENGVSYGTPEGMIDLVPFGDRSGTFDRRYRQPSLTLRKAGVSKPDGAYNVLLLAEGRRTASYFGDRKRSAPWVSMAKSGPWDMAVAWERSDGAPLATVDEATDGFAYNTRIFAARSARGIIIARRGVVDQDGTISRYMTEIWMVLLETFDKDASRDEIVRPSFRVIQRVDHENVDPMSCQSDLPADAQETFRRAADIFRHECRSVPTPIMEKLHFFGEQRMLSRAPAAGSFRDSIRHLDYMAALDEAQLPWQLDIVVAEFGYSSEFAECKMSFTKGETTREMLRRYKAERTLKRGEIVDQMMAEYVYPSSDTWNYTGD